MRDNPYMDEYGTETPLKADDQPAPEAISSNVDPEVPDEEDGDGSED